MIVAVQLGAQQIACHLRRTRRKTLEIAVLPNGEVMVTAPAHANLERVHALVRSRAKWIREQRRYFESLGAPLPPRRYLPGESHRYLGRQYRLRIQRGRKERVKLDGGFLLVSVPATNNRRRVREALERWYAARASAVFGARLSHRLAVWRAAQLAAPSLAVRRMKRRWGSCSPRGRITLNVDLVKAPTACIDYVIVHELCHLKDMSHGRRFLTLLTQQLPDWKRRKVRLDRQEV